MLLTLLLSHIQKSQLIKLEENKRRKENSNETRFIGIQSVNPNISETETEINCTVFLNINAHVPAQSRIQIDIGSRTTEPPD